MKHLLIVLLSSLIVIGGFFQSCKPNNPEVVNKVIFPSDTVDNISTALFFSIESLSDWTISLKFPEGTDDWCRVSPNSGTGTKGGLKLEYSKNESTNNRSVDVKVTFSKGEIITKFVQMRNLNPQEVLISDKVGQCMELPVVKSEDSCVFVTHHTTIKSNSVRNFSIYYDATKGISLWVAYPLCSSYLGNLSRTDEWGYDPKIPTKYQPNYFSGIKSTYGVGDLDRGHQLPSASRLANDETNRQTFYFSNITAQNSSLNQGLWGNLEIKVRGEYIHSCDTLYVVTGPIVKTETNPNIDYIYDKITGKKATIIPKGYYKVVLKYTKATESFSSIGFKFDNKPADHLFPLASDACSVKDIEKITGITFFNNLPNEIKESVKSQYAPKEWNLY